MEGGPLVVQQGLDSLPQVFDQMKSVDHLYGLRCPLPDALGLEGTPVPTDHRDRGILCQPSRHGRRKALGQQVQDAMIFEIDQDGALSFVMGLEMTNVSSLHHQEREDRLLLRYHRQ